MVVLQGPELRWIGLRIGFEALVEAFVLRSKITLRHRHQNCRYRRYLRASASIHVGKLYISRGHPILTLLVSAYHHLRAVYYISVELGGAQGHHI